MDEALLLNKVKRAENIGLTKVHCAPQDEAGLTKTFQTWPRGGFHIP